MFIGPSGVVLMKVIIIPILLVWLMVVHDFQIKNEHSDLNKSNDVWLMSLLMA